MEATQAHDDPQILLAKQGQGEAEIEMQEVPSTYHQCMKFPFQVSKVTIPTNTNYKCNMLKFFDSFVPTKRESTENHIKNLK